MCWTLTEDHQVTLGVFVDSVRLATLSLAPEEKGQLRDATASAAAVQIGPAPWMIQRRAGWG